MDEFEYNTEAAWQAVLTELEFFLSQSREGLGPGGSVFVLAAESRNVTDITSELKTVFPGKVNVLKDIPDSGIVGWLMSCAEQGKVVICDLSNLNEAMFRKIMANLNHACGNFKVLEGAVVLCIQPRQTELCVSCAPDFYNRRVKYV